MDVSRKTRAWSLTDEMVLEVYSMTRKPAVPAPEDLMISLRGTAVRAALKIVQGVYGRNEELAGSLQAALGALAELRYYVYLARRIGVIDVRRYRSVCGRHERAVRCVQDLLADEGKPQASAAPVNARALWSTEENELP